MTVLLGEEVLAAAVLSLDLRVIGAVTVTSSLAFDIGVYLLVVGLVLMVFESFGDDPELDPAVHGPAAPR